jgi:transcriptional regulator with XRE-family HTH domain
MFAYLEQSFPMARGTKPIDPRSREAVAKRLKALRMGLGRSQAEMARPLGSSTSGQLWGNYEDGSQFPRYDILRKITEKFGFSILWIMDGSEDQLTAEQAKIIAIGEMRATEGWRPPKKAKRKP